MNFGVSWDEIVLNFFIFSTSVPSWEPGQPKPMSLTVPSVEKEIKAQMKKMKTAQPLKHRHQLFHLSKIHWKTSVSLSLTVLMPIHLNFIQGDFTRYKSWSRKVRFSHAQKIQLWYIQVAWEVTKFYHKEILFS